MESFKMVFKLIVLIFCLNSIYALRDINAENFHDWRKDSQTVESGKDSLAKKLPLIKVDGTRFINESGDTILFRGLAIADPDKIEREGQWSKKIFSKAKEMGAMIIRIPVHPAAWRDRTPVNYLKLLDQAVEWCTELNMYVIIDWHSIGNLGMEIFQDPSYDTTKKETYEFWRIISNHFTGNNTVAFYELFNEPALFGGRFGRMSWHQWKQINENMIDLIRTYDDETIPLVAGFDWAYDLTPIRFEPINAEGIGYVTHPYPHKRTPPYEIKWEENFGFAADNYPVVATEFGFTMGAEPIKADTTYGKAIVNYLEGKGISWVCWVFDPEWYPNLIESWDTYKLTGSGEFFKKALHGEINK